MPFVDRSASERHKSLTERKVHFVGRHNELHYFIEHILRPEKPTHNIISVYGQAGVGKSTLLLRFIDEVSQGEFKSYCRVALVDDHEASPTSVMEKFAQQLHLANAFEKVLVNYKDALRKLRNEQEAVRDDVLRKVAQTASAAIKEIPVPFISSLAGKSTEIIADYALEKIHAHQLLQDARQLADPLKDLTNAFVEELNTLADSQVMLTEGRTKRRQRIILLFDTFEQLAMEIAPWLLDYFLESEISTNVVLVIAGRYPLERSTPHDPKRWLPYLDTVVYSMPIESFTQDETQKYLQEKGVTDLSQVSTIWELSQGLPLYLGLLTSATERMVDPTADVVANFLRWIPEQDFSKRKLVLDAALLSRPFNEDELAAFPYITEQDRPLLYHWLTTQPFIRTNHLDGRHTYHELAEELFQRHLFQRAPSDYHNTRKMLSVYYQRLLEEVEREEGKDTIATPYWLELKLALVSQLFLCKGKVYRVKAIEQIIDASAYRGSREEIGSYLRKFAEKQPQNLVPRIVQELVTDLLCCIEAEKASQKVLRAINHLLEEVRSCPSDTTSLQAKLLIMRAEVYKNLDELEKALEDCSQAVRLDDANAHIYYVRGSIYDELEDWQAALADISHAIELVPDEIYYYEQRARVYVELQAWQPALVDFTHAIELAPDVPFTDLVIRN